MSESGRILSDIRAYLRVAGAVASRPAASRVIDSHEKAMVFRRLDGNTAQSKIEQTERVPNQTISRWLVDFVREGSVIPPDEYCKNYRALYTLEELDIDISKLKTRARVPPVQQPEPQAPPIVNSVS